MYRLCLFHKFKGYSSGLRQAVTALRVPQTICPLCSTMVWGQFVDISLVSPKFTLVMDGTRATLIDTQFTPLGQIVLYIFVAT